MAPDDNDKLPLFGPGSMTATLTYATPDVTDSLAAGDDTDQLVSGYFNGLAWSPLDGGSLSIAPDIASGNPTSADPVTGMGQGIDTPASSSETISAVPGATASTGGDFNAGNLSAAYQTLLFVDASQHAAAPAGSQAQQPSQPPSNTYAGFVYGGTNYTDVYFPGSSFTFVSDINSSGEVVGGYFPANSGPESGYLYNNGSYTDIHYPGSGVTYVAGINDTGEVVGAANDEIAFVYDGSSYTPINTTLDSIGPLSINDLGEVMGNQNSSSNLYQNVGFVYNNGSNTTIDVPGSAGTFANAINNSGAVAGNYYNTNNQEFGYIYNNGSYTTIDVPGSAGTFANAINNSGAVAGGYYNTNGQELGYIYNNGNYTTVDVPGSTSTNVTGINNTGEVTGTYNVQNQLGLAFIYDGSSYTTVDPPGSSGVDASGDPLVINDTGEVAGSYLTAPCYCRRTLILTARGEVPVEDLAIGDGVVTMSGAVRPIKWIGRRSYAGRFARGQPHILPICIAAGALTAGVPWRDLWVSPHHAMYLEGVLIEARDLINGATIFQAEQVDQIEYFHIELDTHDVLVAEGAYSESFVDADSRSLFHNAHEYRLLYSAEATRQAIICAPRCREGLAVYRARQTIARRAGLPCAAEARVAGALRGFVDSIGPARIHGWAQDVGDPEAPVYLDIFCGDELIGQVLANRMRADLAEAGIGRGNHAFTFGLPAGVRFAPSSVRVRRSLDGAALKYSHSLAQRLGALPRGCLDRVSRSRVSGWAYDGGQSNVPVTLLIFDNDALVGRTVADRYRADLAAAGVGDGRHAFAFDFPEALSTGERHVIRVCRQADQTDLKRSPFVLERAQPPASAIQPVAPSIFPRALFIDSRLPRSGQDAGSIAILSHIRSLQRLGYQAAFAAAPQFTGAAEYSAALEALGVTCYRAPDYRSIEEVLQYHAGEFDLVYLHRIANAAKYGELVRHHFPKARLVYSVADLYHLRLARQASVEGRSGLIDQARRLRLLEFTAAALADKVVTHSAEEARLLQAQVGPAKVHIVRWSACPKPTAVPFAQRRGIAFIGNYDHPPNVDAARWLITDIMPRVRQRDPAIECLLVGAGLPDALRDCCGQGVIALGRVDNLAEIFARVRLTVAPLRYGAGIKGKVVDGIAAGLPCVCSPIAAEGMELPPTLGACIADGAEAIAATIYQLHSNRQANIACGRAGLRYIEDAFSEHRLDTTMREVVEPHVGPVWLQSSSDARPQVPTREGSRIRA